VDPAGGPLVEGGSLSIPRSEHMERRLSTGRAANQRDEDEQYSKELARGVQLMREAQPGDPVEVCLPGGFVGSSFR
jgi:hypothetical protein